MTRTIKIVLVTFIKAQVLSYMKWFSLDTVKFNRLICLCVWRVLWLGCVWERCNATSKEKQSENYRQHRNRPHINSCSLKLIHKRQPTQSCTQLRKWSTLLLLLMSPSFSWPTTNTYTHSICYRLKRHHMYMLEVRWTVNNILRVKYNNSHHEIMFLHPALDDSFHFHTHKFYMNNGKHVNFW